MSDAPDSGGEPANRRPIAARGTAAARWLTRQLLRTPVTPNQVSLASIGFAAIGAWAVLAGREARDLIAADEVTLLQRDAGRRGQQFRAIE